MAAKKRRVTTHIDWYLMSPVQNLFHRIVIRRDLERACERGSVPTRMLDKCQAFKMGGRA
jgi:hypothetical protein